MYYVRVSALLPSLCFIAATSWATDLDRVDSEEFLHVLEFDQDGVLPSAEAGAFADGGDGWEELGAWTIDGGAPPSLSVAGGVLSYDTTGFGEGGALFYLIDHPDGLSAWSTEVSGETSWTVEVRLRTSGPADGAESVSDPGTAIWVSDGSGRRSVAVVDVDQVRWGVGGGPVIHEGDNGTEFVTMRIARDAESGWTFVWRNGELITRDSDGTGNDGRIAIFILDYGATSEAAGELDYVRWDSEGAFAPLPAGDDTPPAAPTGLTAEGEDGQVLLDWDDNGDSDLLCYAVKRSTSPGGPYEVIDADVLSSELVDTDVANGTSYHYVVSATDGEGNESNDSAEASATPDVGLDVTPPAAPTGLTATPQAGGNLFVDWLDNAEPDLASYTVWRSEVTGGPYDVIADGLGPSEYEDSNVDPLVRYYYVVAAVDDADNESDPSNEASAALTVSLGDRVEKEAADFPHKLLFDVDGILPSEEGAADGWGVDDAWNTTDAAPPSLSVADGLLRFESVLAGQQAVTLQAASAWADEVDPTTSFTFEVRLRVTASAGPNPGAILWMANGEQRVIIRVDTNAVSTFSGVLLHEGDNSTELVTIRVAYDAVTDTFHVWRDGAQIGSNLGNDGAAAGGRTAMFLVDCCSSVQVTGEFDSVCWDATGAFLPPVDENDVTPPDAPTGLTAVSEDSRAHLRWDANTEEDFSSYELGRSETPGGPYDVVYVGGATSFTDEGLTNGATYYYVVSATDVNRNTSDPSAEVAATPEEGVDLTPPAALTGLIGRSTVDGEVSLSWEVSPDLDADTYRVHRAERSGGPYDRIAEGILLFETVYVDDAVSFDTTYFYVVTVVDLVGNESDPSNEVDVTPERFDEFEERAASAFAHKLLFEEDGVIPSVEGAADGWAEDAAWNIDSDAAPSLSVSDGLLRFNSVLPGQQSITLQAGSAWAAEVDPGTSYTFETSLRISATNAPNPGATLWLANGATRIIVRVDLNQTATWSGLILDEEDNSTEPITIRIAYHAPTDLYFVWRNDELIGDGLPNDGNASRGRTAVFLIDCCSTVQAEGEMDYVCWDATGAYAPGDDIVDPPRPLFFRGDTDGNGNLELTDGVFVFNFLFLGGTESTCKEATDSNNDGRVDLTDGVVILNHLFLGGAPPPSPGPPAIGECGTDPDPLDSPGDLGCEEYGSCP